MNINLSASKAISQTTILVIMELDVDTIFRNILYDNLDQPHEWAVCELENVVISKIKEYYILDDIFFKSISMINHYPAEVLASFTVTRKESQNA